MIWINLDVLCVRQESMFCDEQLDISLGNKALLIAYLLRTSLENLTIPILINNWCIFVKQAVGDAAIASYVLKNSPQGVDTFAVCFCWGVGAMIGITATAAVSGELKKTANSSLSSPVLFD